MTAQELQVVEGLVRESGLDLGDPTPHAREVFHGILESLPVDESFAFTTGERGGVPTLELAASEATDAVVLYLHGGGYIAGTASGYRGLAGNIARAAGASLVSVDYRLAEDHPYPAAIDDAMAAYRAVLDSGTPASRVVVVGDSAGGGLTLALLQRARDEGLALPAAAVTLSPWADLTQSSRSMRENADRDYSLAPDSLQRCADRYLGGADAASTPYASPAHGSFEGLPPLYVTVGSGEILLSDAISVAESAALAGVDVTLHVAPDMPHDWSLFAFMLSEGRDAIDEVGAFVRRHLA